MAREGTVATKRRVIGQVLICRGCCCGAVERGRPEVPVDWLKAEWRRRGLLKRVQLTISGCLGPCDVPNVVVFNFGPETGAQWFGNVAGNEMYRDIVDWASASVAAGQPIEVPPSFAGHLIEPFR